MKENNLNITQVIKVIIQVLIFGISSSLAVILGILLANFSPKLDINKPFLIKAYQSLIRQDIEEIKEEKSIKNSFLFTEDETEISKLGAEVLNDLILQIQTKQISIIKIISYTQKTESSSLKLANLVKQYLEKSLTKNYHWVIIGYSLPEDDQLNSRVEIRLD